MFSKPVSREVEAKDVKYAIERAFSAQRAERLRGRLLRRPHGRARASAGEYKEIPGIETPDDSHDRLQAQQGHGRRAGRRARDADLDPGAEGVRAEVRQGEPVDLRPGGTRSTPAPTWSSPTPQGKATGYVPGKSIKLVRNPDYAAGRRLPPRVPRRDRDPGRQRRHRGGHAAHPERREHGVRRHRAAGEPAQAAARVEQDRALGGAGRWLAHDLDRHEPPAVRRHRRPQGRHRRLQPRRRAPAARRRGARPDRPALHPAGHGGLRGVRRRRGLDRRGGLDAEPGGRPQPRRPSTSRRRASPRASTRAARRS